MKQVQLLVIVNIYNAPSDIQTIFEEYARKVNEHFDKLSEYIEAQLPENKINTEYIDIKVFLQKIYNFSKEQQHKRWTHNSNGAISIIQKKTLTSVMEMLKLNHGHETTRKRLIDLGWSLIEDCYRPFNYDKLIFLASIHAWLKSQDLIKDYPAVRSRYRGSDNNTEQRYSFEISEEELEVFYDQNRRKIYQYMIDQMDGCGAGTKDPMEDQEAKDFYHYYESFKNMKHCVVRDNISE